MDPGNFIQMLTLGFHELKHFNQVSNATHSATNGSTPMSSMLPSLQTRQCERSDTVLSKDGKVSPIVLLHRGRKKSLG